MGWGGGEILSDIFNLGAQSANPRHDNQVINPPQVHRPWRVSGLPVLITTTHAPPVCGFGHENVQLEYAYTAGKHPATTDQRCGCGIGRAVLPKIFHHSAMMKDLSFISIDDERIYKCDTLRNLKFFHQQC